MGVRADADSAAWKKAGLQIALCGTVAGVAATVVESATDVPGTGAPQVAGLMQNMLAVGAPVALGTAISTYLFQPNTKDTKMSLYLKRGGLAAVIAAGVSVYAGTLPMQFDMQMVNFGVLVVGSVWAGDTLADQLEASKAK